MANFYRDALQRAKKSISLRSEAPFHVKDLSKQPTKLIKFKPKMAFFVIFRQSTVENPPKTPAKQELPSLCHFFSQGGKNFTDEQGVGQAGIAVDLQTEGKEPADGGETLKEENGMKKP